MATQPSLGWLYFLPVGLATSSLLVLSVRLISKPGQSRALALFYTSNLYLAVVMLMICVNTLVS